MGQDRTGHHDGEPDCAEERVTRDQEGDGSRDLDETGHGPKPLPEPDLLEGLDHHGYAGELGAARAEEDDGKNDLKTPGGDVAGTRRRGRSDKGLRHEGVPSWARIGAIADHLRRRSRRPTGGRPVG